MYKGELIECIALDTKLHEGFVREVVEDLFKNIVEALDDNDPVVIPGFGTFYTRTHPGGTVKHIRTGEVVRVGPRREAAFRPADALKRSLRGRRR